MPPLIGLNMSIESTAASGVERLFVPPDYVAAVAGAGGAPVCIPPGGDLATIREIIARLQGFLFIGGADYHPAHYGGHPQPAEELVHPRRDRFDITLAKTILEETDLPVLGICGGCQLLSIVRGGALIQDIGTEWRPPGGGPPLPHSAKGREHALESRSTAVASGVTPEGKTGRREGTAAKPTIQSGGKPDPATGEKNANARSALEEEYRHLLRLAPQSLAAHATGTPPGEEFAANSFHHQAVHPERVGNGLAASAWSSDGVIEAIEATPGSSWAATGRFVLGVQWHPERLPDEEPHRLLFRSLVRAAVGSGRRRSA